MRLDRGRSLALLVGAAVLIGLLAMLAWPSVPRGLAPTLMTGLTLLFLAYAWNLVGGILGELSFAHMAFWAIGSYGLVLAGNAEQDMRLVVVACVAAAAALGWLIVTVAGALGLEGLYLATFTLIVFELARSLVTGVEQLGKNEGVVLLELTSPDTAAYLSIGLVLVAFLANLLVLRSTLGRRWLAIKDDIVAAEAVGIFARREKALAYALSAGLTALGGALQAYYVGYAQPETSLGIALLVSAVLAVFVGGPGTLFGPLIGTIIVYGLSAIATNVSTSLDVSLYAQILQYAVAFAIFWFLSLSKSPRIGILNIVRALLARSRAVPPEPGAPEPATVAPLPLRVTSRADGPGAGAHGPVALRIDHVSKRFGGVRVLEDVAFDVRAGEIVGLMGPNGAGKTTLCNIITGVNRPDSGRVLAVDEDLRPYSTPQRFHRGVARTFQAARLFPSLSIANNIAVAVPGGSQRAEELLNKFELDGQTSSLNAPMFVRRLTEVARALGGSPRVLILDEPLAGLTHAQHELILNAVKEVAEEGTAVLLIEHLIQAVAPVCDRLVAMADGRVIADGPPDEVVRDEAVVDAYLGRASTTAGVRDVVER
jgi:branched-chain amino acid transport system permease protein